MRVLLMDSHPGTAGRTEALLVANGHEVVRCRDPKRPSDPCAAFDAACPLDVDEVDVAIDVRAVAMPNATPGEQGVVCARRAGVPTVVAGATTLHPFGPLGVREHDGDDGLIDVAGTAIAAAAAAEAQRIARAAGESAGQVVEVERQGDELVLVVRGASGREAASAAVRAHAGARSADPAARRIRVSTDPDLP